MNRRRSGFQQLSTPSPSGVACGQLPSPSGSCFLSTLLCLLVLVCYLAVKHIPAEPPLERKLCFNHLNWMQFLAKGMMIDYTTLFCWHIQRQAQYSLKTRNFHKTSTFSFTSASQLLQYVYATGSPAERYMSCQTKSSKLGLMQLERLGAYLSIFFLLATSVENEEYALTRKRNKSSKLRILMRAVLRSDRGGKWLDGNITPGAGRKKVRVTPRVRGWCASKVWCVGRVYLDLSRFGACEATAEGARQTPPPSS